MTGWNYERLNDKKNKPSGRKKGKQANAVSKQEKKDRKKQRSLA